MHRVWAPVEELPRRPVTEIEEDRNTIDAEGADNSFARGSIFSVIPIFSATHCPVVPYRLARTRIHALKVEVQRLGGNRDNIKSRRSPCFGGRARALRCTRTWERKLRENHALTALSPDEAHQPDAPQ